MSEEVKSNSRDSGKSRSENVRVTKAAGIVGAATLISRILGYVRDMVFAGFFGASFFSDAFIAAFRIPNTLRRLFGEGSLSIAFVPVFTEYLAKDKGEAFSLARSAIRVLGITLILLSITGILLSPWIVQIMAPGFTKTPDKLSLTVNLAQIMIPYIFFIGLVALCMGILNALGHFAAPALAPVLLNVAMITGMISIAFFTEDPTVRVYGLSGGVMIGGLLQLAFQVPFLKRKGIFRGTNGWFHPGLKKVGILMLPTVFGSAVYQINILVGTALASLLTEGSVSYLFFADRLVQFPLGIFAIATATAVLPSLSRQAAAGDHDALGNTFVYSMNFIFFITIPAMVGLIVLREPIIRLLFERGAFDAEGTRQTAIALFYYSLGLWAFSGVRIVVSVFYALRDTKTPVRTAALSIMANIALGASLMWPLGHGGLALATSLSSMLNLALLLIALKKKLGALGWKNMFLSSCKSLINALIMGAVVMGLVILAIPDGPVSFIRLLSGLVASIGAGMIVYGFFSYITKSPELTMIMDLAKRTKR